MILEDPRSIRLPVIRVRQPIGDFYVGTMGSKDLVAIADFDVRRINQGEGIETYLGIQRELNKERVKEISQYVEGPDATFPTAVVLAVESKAAVVEPACPESRDHFWLELHNVPSIDPEECVLFREIAKVIDGQHRIVGLKNYSENQPFDVNVSIFVGADAPDQAAIFSTVNLAQTKVNRSLVYDLFDLAKAKSPEKLAHNVVVALDRAENSPFHRRIKRLGTATVGRFFEEETLTQATVVSPILRYISGNQIQLLKDRQTGLRGRPFETLESNFDALVFRPFLLQDDAPGLADLLWNYFEAVSERWDRAWNGGVERGMLNKTNGYNALMRFFRPVYLHLAQPGQGVTKQKFKEVFDNIILDDEDFNTLKYIPGTSGATALYNDMVSYTGFGR